MYHCKYGIKYRIRIGERWVRRALQRGLPTAAGPVRAGCSGFSAFVFELHEVQPIFNQGPYEEQLHHPPADSSKLFIKLLHYSLKIVDAESLSSSGSWCIEISVVLWPSGSNLDTFLTPSCSSKSNDRRARSDSEVLKIVSPWAASDFIHSKDCEEFCSISEEKPELTMRGSVAVQRGWASCSPDQWINSVCPETPTEITSTSSISDDNLRVSGYLC